MLRKLFAWLVDGQCILLIDAQGRSRPSIRYTDDFGYEYARRNWWAGGDLIRTHDSGDCFDCKRQFLHWRRG